MSTYSHKRLGKTTPKGRGVDAIVVRNSDGATVTGVTNLATAKRWAKDMNDETRMGVYLISVIDEVNYY